jgi:hypothetical protein
LVTVFVMRRGQPALLWIVPAVLFPTLIASTAQGLLGKFWRTGAVDPASHAKAEEDDLVIKTSSGDNNRKEKGPQSTEGNGEEHENSHTREGEVSWGSAE